jgi:hypothetical protein
LLIVLGAATGILAVIAHLLGMIHSRRRGALVPVVLFGFSLALAPAMLFTDSASLMQMAGVAAASVLGLASTGLLARSGTFGDGAIAWCVAIGGAMLACGVLQQQMPLWQPATMLAALPMCAIALLMRRAWLGTLVGVIAVTLPVMVTLAIAGKAYFAAQAADPYAGY